MQKRIYYIFILLYCLSCNNKKKVPPANSGNTPSQMTFDKSKWKVKQDNQYPYRDSMLQHLITSDTLRGLTKQQVLALLGPPSRTDTNYLFYKVAQKRIGFFPLHTKSLVLHLPGDSIVTWIKIHK